MSRLSKFGVVITVFYGLLLFAFFLADWNQFRLLEPNEWGDFLAGSLGPLAIFWLVLGFFQQGRELQNSTDSLRLQAKELRAAVEQQKELADSNRQMVLAQDVRWRSEMSLELSKLASDCEELIIKISEKIPQVENSRMALLASDNMTNSGAAVQFEGAMNEQRVFFSDVQKRYNDFELRKIQATNSPTTDDISLLYQMRSRLTTILGKLEGYLSADDRRRLQKIQQESAKNQRYAEGLKKAFGPK